jgi:adenylate cyclase
VSWTTRRPGGFSDRDVAMLRALTPYLGLVFGSLAGQRKVEAVLRTYLGVGPGREVAEGKVRRGDIRRIDAVVLLTDLRGFTRKAAELAEPELLDALNDYFGCVADAVSAGGGDILKFIGDGVLSCFPVADQAELPKRCRDAVAAVRLARSALAPVNARREAEGRPRLDFVAAMDAGSLSYGNIGAADRLDFTVVGPAVNIASRIESLAKELGEKTLVTAAIAGHLAHLQPRKVASRVLRGLSEPVELYALD